MEKYEALRLIESNKKQLTKQQRRTLVGQTLAGSPDAAIKGLRKILYRNEKRKERGQ